MSKTFCILPWVHLAVFPEGTAKICCVANQRINQDGATLSLQSQTLEDVWNSDYMRTVRRDMVAGTPVKDCEHCYLAEKEFGTSWRTHNNKRWGTELGAAAFDAVVDASVTRDFVVPESPVWYQLMPGNLCNLKCRMCFPTFSSLIERDEVHSRWTGPLFPAPSVGTFLKDPASMAGPNRLPDGPWYRDDAWVREVLLKNTDTLRALYFTGGEPMIEKQVENILDHLIDRGVAGNVSLEFNTNATILRDSMVEKLQRFKRVVLSLSLDAFGRNHEYIRYPARWSTIVRNVERMVALAGDRISLSAQPVLQVYNALNLAEVLQFFDEMKVHYQITIATDPWFLSVGVLPMKVRRVAAERLRAYAAGRSNELPFQDLQAYVRSVAAHLESAPDRSSRDSLRTLMLFTNDLDAGRKQSFREVHAELLGLLAESGFEWTDEPSPDPAAAQAAVSARAEVPVEEARSGGSQLIKLTVGAIRRWVDGGSAKPASAARGGEGGRP